MKTYITLFLFTGLMVGIINGANAQRGRDGGGGRSGGQSSAAPQMRSGGGGGNYSSPRAYSQNYTRSAPVQNSPRTFSPSSNGNYRNYSQRNVVTRNNGVINTPVGRQNNLVANSGYRGRAGAYGRSNNIAYSGNFRYNNRYYGGGYYNYNNRRYSFMYGPRYNVLPRSFVSINFGGYPYYYNSGLFYGYYGGFYQPIFPPFGLQIGMLPYGYYSFYLGGYPYYYYNGIYYQQYDNYYEVVDAPLGASVYSLPQGAKAVILNGEKLYELNGTYYKEDRDAKGQTIYTVVGKNGTVNNTDEGSVTNNGNNLNNGTPNSQDPNVNQNPGNSGSDQPSATPQSPAPLELGDIITQLPQGSRTVTINGEKMFVTPDNSFLKEETNNGVVQYEVVGQ